MTDTMRDLDDMRARAAAIGLDKLTDAHLEQLTRATLAAERRIDQLDVPLDLADEPAHVYDAGGK